MSMLGFWVWLGMILGFTLLACYAKYRIELFKAKELEKFDPTLRVARNVLDIDTAVVYGRGENGEPKTAAFLCRNGRLVIAPVVSIYKRDMALIRYGWFGRHIFRRVVAL